MAVVHHAGVLTKVLEPLLVHVLRATTPQHGPTILEARLLNALAYRLLDLLLLTEISISIYILQSSNMHINHLYPYFVPRPQEPE